MRLLMPLFSPPTGTWGGLTRVLAVAEAAERAGHTVAFGAAGFVEAALKRRGYRVYPIPASTMFGLPAGISRRLEARTQYNTPPVGPGKSIGDIWFVFAISGMARIGFLRELVRAELDIVQDFQPDVLFTDLNPGAYLVAAITGLPLAGAYADIILHGHGSLGWRLANRAINAVLKEYGMPARTPEELCFSPSNLKIIPSIPELDGTDPARPDVRYVGHLLADLEAEPVDDLPLRPGRRCVFAYTGTGSISLADVRRVLPSIFPEGGDLDCLVGGQSIAAPERIGAVQFRPYIPVEAILPACDWVLCHGGQNTIIQALRRGVPLIIFPGPIFERRFNARKVQEAGAGLMGEINQFTPDWLEAAFAQREACAQHAAELGARICAQGGADAAVEAIMSWAGNR